MNAWHKFKLKELASLKTGKLDSNAANTEGKYPFFTCSQETYYIDDYAFDTTAILLGGNNAAGIFPLKFYSGKFNCYQRTYVIETINEKCSLKFLYYSLYLKLDFLKGLSIGATTKFLTKRVLDDLEIYLPGFPIQQKIAATLSAYDDLIENNLKQIKLLEEMAQITYQEWFVRLKFPNHENTPMDEETGLPLGWEYKKLGEQVELIKDSVLPENLDNVRYIGLEHMPRKSIVLSEYGNSDNVNSLKLIVKKGDILFGKIRPYFHKVGVALDDCITSTDNIVLRATEKKLHGIILQTVYSDEFVKAAIQSSNGTKMPRANWDVLKNFQIIAPEKNVLTKFSEFSDDIIFSISNLAKQNQLLKEARDILLPRLMTGKITVGADLSAQCE